jgi:hypothetical protein
MSGAAIHNNVAAADGPFSVANPLPKIKSMADTDEVDRSPVAEPDDQSETTTIVGVDEATIKEVRAWYAIDWSNSV